MRCPKCGERRMGVLAPKEPPAGQQQVPAEPKCPRCGFDPRPADVVPLHPLIQQLAGCGLNAEAPPLLAEQKRKSG